MNQIETLKIGQELEKLGFTVTDNTGTILHFAQGAYNGPMMFRDKNKALVKVKFPYFHLYYEAGVNPAGVGDGLDPNQALTYSIGFCLATEKRGYRCKYFWDDEFSKFYAYSRDLGTLIDKLHRHLITCRALHGEASYGGYLLI